MEDGVKMMHNSFSDRFLSVANEGFPIPTPAILDVIEREYSTVYQDMCENGFLVDDNLDDLYKEYPKTSLPYNIELRFFLN